MSPPPAVLSFSEKIFHHSALLRAAASPAPAQRFTGGMLPSKAEGALSQGSSMLPECSALPPSQAAEQPHDVSLAFPSVCPPMHACMHPSIRMCAGLCSPAAHPSTTQCQVLVLPHPPKVPQRSPVLWGRLITQQLIAVWDSGKSNLQPKVPCAHFWLSRAVLHSATLPLWPCLPLSSSPLTL